MKKSTTRIAAILIAVVLLIGGTIGVISASASPNYVQSEVDRINAALTSFENKVSGGTLYTSSSLQTAYNAYVNLSRTLDRYYYGNDSSIAGSITTQITALNTAMNNMTVWNPPTVTTPSIAAGDKEWPDNSATWSTTKSLYKNVLYVQNDYNNAQRATISLNNISSVQLYYPMYVLLYDGVTNPSFGVAIKAWAGTNNSNRYWYAAALTNSASDGLSLDGLWSVGHDTHAACSDVNFYHNMTTSYFFLGNNATTTPSGNGASLRDGCGFAGAKKNHEKVAANTITFDGSKLGATEYKRTVKPNIEAFFGSNQTAAGQGNWNSDQHGVLEGTQDVFIVNYAPLKNAIQNAVNIFKNVRNYREGGLNSNFFTALNNAMNFNYNSYFERTNGWTGGWADAENRYNNCTAAIKDLTEKLNGVSTQTDQYNDLRTAIDNARNLYFEDTANPGGTNPVKADGRVKYCPTPWKTFAAAYKTAGDGASSFMSDSAANNNYNNKSTAVSYANALNTAKSKVTEHIVGSTTYKQIPASGSEFYDTKYKMATCTESGLVAVLSDCPNCKEAIYIQDETINAAGHTNMTERKGWDATCTQDGAVTYYTCNRAVDNANFIAAGCGKMFLDALGNQEINSEPDPIPATQHQFVLEQAGKDKTCLNGTYYEIWKCTVCEKYFLSNSNPLSEAYIELEAYEGEQSDKLDHTLQHNEPVDATCEHEGNKEYWSCETCNTIFRSNNQLDIWVVTDSDTYIIPQLAHSFTKYEYNNDQDCVTDGTETAYCEYEMNQPEDERETHTRPAEGKAALGHDWDSEDHPYKAPTCVDGGNIEYYHCNRCNTNYYDKADKTTMAVNGSTELPATGQHSPVEHYAQNATCQNAGWETYYECGVCHQCFDSIDCTNRISETDDITDWSGYTAVGDHVLIAHPEKEATCKDGDDGWDAYWQCALCDNYYSSNDQTGGHDAFEEYKIDVDDITEWSGYHPYTSVAHNVIDLTEPATCVSSGYGEHYECKVCGTWFNAKENGDVITEQPTEDPNPDNHTGIWNTFAQNDGATCLQDGWKQTVYQCADCGKYYTNKNDNDTTGETAYTLETLKAAGIYTEKVDHNREDVKTETITDSTCVTLGYKQTTYSCTWCGTIQEVVVEQLTDYAAHTPNPVEYKAPTCMAAGTQAHNTCSVCGKYFKAEDTACTGTPLTDEEIAALVINSVGHDFSVEGDEKVEATCTTNAIVEYSCSYGCNNTTDLEKPDTKTGHNMTDHAKADATCLTDGVPNTYYSCDWCNLNYADNEDYTTNIYTGELTTPAKGHTFVAHAGYAATCNTPGKKTYYTCSNDNCELNGAKLLSNTNTKATLADCIANDSELEIAKDPVAHPQDALSYVPAKEYDCKTWTDGMRAHNYCSECRNYYEISDIWYEHAKSESDFIVKPEHTLVLVPAQEKTCIDNGWSDFYYCTVCNPEPNEDMELFSAEEKATSEHGDLTFADVLDKAVGHTFTTYTDAVTATCVTEGNLGYVECDVCHIKLICDTIEDADIWAADDQDDSDKIDLGLDPDNHEGPFVEVKGTEAGCIEDGIKDHYECSACGAKFMDEEGNTPATDDSLKIEHTGHSFPEGSAHDAVLPTCRVEGTRMYYTCDNCHKNFALNDPNQVVELTDTRIDPTYQHKLAYHAARNATCEEKGYDAYWQCSLCGDTFSSGDQGEATADGLAAFDANKVTVTPAYGIHKLIHFSAVEATCSVKGYAEYWECAICEKTFNSNDKTEMETDLEKFNEEHTITVTPALDPTKHNISQTGGTPATCVAPGVAAHYECEWCGEWFVDADGSETTAKTPAEAPIDENNHINAWIGHTYQKATCQQEGWLQTVYECKGCGAFYSSHSGATTTSDAKLGTSKAELSAEYYEAQKPHNELGQSKEQELVKSTCTTQGYKLVTYTCDMCGADQRTELVQLAFAEHQTTKVEVEAPTCYSDGVKKAHLVCSVCGKFFEVGENGSVGAEIEDKTSVVDPRVKHDYTGTKTILTSANCTDYAVISVECVYGCGASINRPATAEDGDEYAPIDHDYVKHEATDSTCIEAGYETYYTCNNDCGTLFNATKEVINEIPYKALNPNNHPEASVSKAEDAVKVTCLENGWVERNLCSACGKYFAEGIEGVKDSVDDPAFAIEAQGHTFGAYVPAVEATCKVQGSEGYYECSVCNIKVICKEADKDSVKFYAGNDSDKIDLGLDPTNHKNVIDVDGVAAKCLEDGTIAHKKCTDCNTLLAMDGKTVITDTTDPKTGHTFVYVAEKIPTCEDKKGGWKTHYTCENCNLKFLDASDRFSTGVDYDTEIALDPDPANHTNLEHVDEVPATCDKAGMRAHYYCSGCDNYYEVSDATRSDAKTADDFVIPAAHKLELVPAQNAICNVKGWDAYYQCSVCSKTFEDDAAAKEITAEQLENTWKHYGDHLLIQHAAKPGDCQTKGWDEYYECAYCQAKFEDNAGQKAIADFENDWMKFGAHDIRQTGGTPATCIAEGEGVHFECVICGNWFKDTTGSEQVDKETPVTGVNENNHVNGWITHEKQDEATCKADYWKQTVYECAACGKFYSAHNDGTTKNEDKLGDSLADLKEKGIYAEKLDHNFTDSGCKVEETVLQEASCTLEGLKRVDTYCSMCETAFVTTTEKIAKLAHTPKYVGSTPATCYSEGVREHNECTECGQYFAATDTKCENDPISKESTVIPRDDHVYTGKIVSTVISATCTENATIEVKCKYNCGATTTRLATAEDGDEYVATGHVFEKHEGKDSTCMEAGYDTYYTCKNGCGTLFSAENPDAIINAIPYKELAPHNYTGEIVKTVIEAGCLTNATVEVACIYGCGATDNQESTAEGYAAKGHTFTEYHNAVEPTCVAGGNYGYVECDVCHIKQICASIDAADTKYAENDSVDLDIVPENHKLNHVQGEEATCTDTGIKDHYICEYCNKTFADQDGKTPLDDLTIEAKGHKYTNYVYDGNQDCWTDGTETAYCDNACGTKHTKPAEGKEATGHDFEAHAYKAPTCVENGNIEYYYCKNCKTNYYDNGEKTTAEISGTTVLDKTGQHSLTKHAAVKATCQNAGWEEYWECSVCHILYDSADQENGKVIDKLEEWNGYTALGKHVLIAHPEKEATCKDGDDGWDAYWECALCKNFYDADMPSEGYDYDKFEEHNINVTDITEWDGYTFAKDVKHNIGENLACAPTCVAPGYGEHYECSVCHKWFKDESGQDQIEVKPDAPIDPNNHTGHWITNAKKDATCQETGFLLDNVQCADCHKYYEDETAAKELTEAQVIDPIKEHDQKIKEESTVGSIEPTCTSSGQQMYIIKCSMCGTIQDTVVETLDPIAHTPNYVPELSATCYSEGLEEHYECTVCKQLFAFDDTKCENGPITKESITIDRVAHDYTGDIKEVTPATCLKYAVIEVACKYGCGATETRSATDADANGKYAPTGHKEKTVKENEAEGVDCQHFGTYDEVVYCENEWCDLNGAALRSETKNTDKVGPHVAGEAQQEERKEATCTDEGSYKLVTRCKYHNDVVLSSENMTIDATGHTFKYVEGKTPNCEEGGYKAYYTCDNCELVFLDASESNRFDKVGVDYDKDIKLDKDPNNHTKLAHVDEVPATCDKSGMRAHYHCEGCGNYYEVSDLTTPVEDGEDAFVTDAAHKLVAKDAKTATCVDPGWGEYWQCSVCDKFFNSNDPSAEGLASREELDGYIEHGAHVLIAHAAKEATCKEGDDGWKAYWECALCGKCYDSDDQSEGYDAFETDHYIVNTKDDISKWDKGYTFSENVEHKVEDDLATPATCVEPGYDEHYECSVCGKWFLDLEGTQPTDEKPVADIDPNNHAGGHWNEHPAQDVKCYQDGWSKLVYECEDCGYYYFAENKDGNTTNVDGMILEDLADVITPAIPHNKDKKVAMDIGTIPATCTSAGQQMYYLYCDMCDNLQDVAVEPIPIKPHEPTTTEVIKGSDPTCQVEGVKDHFECANCHQYFADDDPTCEKDPIDIVIPKVDHDFSNHDEDHTVIVTPADCWNNAKVEYLCAYNCNTHSKAVEDENYGKLGHNFTADNSHDYKAPTCLTDGNPEYYYCDRCDQNYADNAQTTTNTFNGDLTLPATGHSFELVDGGTVPTCASEGSKAYYKCTKDTCDLTKDGVEAKFIYDADTKSYTAIADDSELKLAKDPLNHTDGLAPQKEVAANCDTWEVGYRAHIYCSNCENYYEIDDLSGANPLKNGKKDLEIAPVHTLNPVNDKAPSCLVDGWRSYYECAVCGEKFLDNTPNVENGVDYDKDIKSPATDHKAGAPVNENVVYGENCQEKGSHDEVVYCANEWCDVEGGAELNRTKVTDAPGPHVAGEPKWEDIKEATCTEDGSYDLVTRCSLCDTELNRVKDQVITKTGHDFTDYKSNGNATCLTDGTETAICNNCGTETNTKTEVNSATGHDFVLVDEQAKGATCLEDGVKAHYECQNDYCDLTVDGEKAKFLDNTDTMAEEGVDDSELVIPSNLDQKSHVNLHFEKGYDPTCAPWTIGMRDHITCDCETYYEVSDIHYETPLTKADFEIAPEHTLADMGEQAVTCEVDGYNHYWECTVEGCGQQFLAYTPGVEKGVVYDDEIAIFAQGHTEGEIVIENKVKGENCQVNGSHDEVIYCVNDWCDVKGGKELSRETIIDEVGAHEADEPKWEDVVDASCTTDGSYDLVTRCKHCGIELDRVEDQVIPAKGHSYGEWETVESPDCVNGGSKKHTCEVCGFVETEDLDPNGHDWEDDYTIDKEPACTEDGSKSIHCKNCDVQKDSEVIKANGHAWEDDYTIDKEPTCTEAGSKSIHCKNCDAQQKFEEVPALGHDWIIDEAVPATPTEDGLTEGKHCSRGDAKVDQEVVPATGEIPLEILKGENQTYLIDSNKDKTIVCSGNFHMFIELLLEGEHVGEANYTLKEGSTIITFKPEYLNTLAPGVYKVTLVYTYGSIDTTLTIIEETTTEAPTETTTEAPTETTTKAPAETTTETTTEKPKAPVSNGSSTSPVTGLVISIPVLSLAALAGSSFFFGYARKKKNEDEE